MHLYLLATVAAAASPYCTEGTLGHVRSTEAVPRSTEVIASVCCHASCQQCGGVDCWAQPGGLACCAAHTYSVGAPTCALPSDTGCILPDPSVASLPNALREATCLDHWSLQHPGEREDWKGKSCKYKVEWGQCSQFYANCQCSCGYCNPSKPSCDPHAHSPPPPHPHHTTVQHHLPPPPAAAAPDWEALFSAPSTSAPPPPKPTRAPTVSAV